MKSENLEIGKAGEYLAVFELINQGYSAFLSDQGLSFDIVVEHEGRLFRGQVKSTLRHSNYGKSKNVMRFGTRNGKKTERSASCHESDFYAFVCIEDKEVYFMHESELRSSKNKGSIKQTIDLRHNENSLEKEAISSTKTNAKVYKKFSRIEGMLNGNS